MQKAEIARMIRVDQAGELAATKIYEGQLSILSRSAANPILNEMLDQEKTHLSSFNTALKTHNVSPTVFNPLWERIAYGLGVATALMGKRAAMACTIAVEEVIETHYKKQLSTLPKDAPTTLRATIQKCYEDEISHKEVAEHHGGRSVSGYRTLSKAIKFGCRTAIWLSERA